MQIGDESVGNEQEIRLGETQAKVNAEISLDLNVDDLFDETPKRQLNATKVFDGASVKANTSSMREALSATSTNQSTSPNEGSKTPLLVKKKSQSSTKNCESSDQNKQSWADIVENISGEYSTNSRVIRSLFLNSINTKNSFQVLSYVPPMSMRTGMRVEVPATKEKEHETAGHGADIAVLMLSALQTHWN